MASVWDSLQSTNPTKYTDVKRSSKETHVLRVPSLRSPDHVLWTKFVTTTNYAYTMPLLFRSNALTEQSGAKIDSIVHIADLESHLLRASDGAEFGYIKSEPKQLILGSFMHYPLQPSNSSLPIPHSQSRMCIPTKTDLVSVNPQEQGTATRAFLDECMSTVESTHKFVREFADTSTPAGPLPQFGACASSDHQPTTISTITAGLPSYASLRTTKGYRDSCEETTINNNTLPVGFTLPRDLTDWKKRGGDPSVLPIELSESRRDVCNTLLANLSVLKRVIDQDHVSTDQTRLNQAMKLKRRCMQCLCMAIGGTTFGQSRASKLSLLLGNDTGSSASLMSPRILMRCLETKKSVQVGHSVLVPTEFTVLNMTDAMALHQAPSLLGHSLMLSPVREELPFEVSGFMNCPAIKARWIGADASSFAPNPEGNLNLTNGAEYGDLYVHSDKGHRKRALLVRETDRSFTASVKDPHLLPVRCSGSVQPLPSRRLDSQLRISTLCDFVIAVDRMNGDLMVMRDRPLVAKSSIEKRSENPAIVPLSSITESIDQLHQLLDLWNAPRVESQPNSASVYSGATVDDLNESEFLGVVNHLHVQAQQVSDRLVRRLGDNPNMGLASATKITPHTYQQVVDTIDGKVNSWDAESMRLDEQLGARCGKTIQNLSYIAKRIIRNAYDAAAQMHSYAEHLHASGDQHKSLSALVPYHHPRQLGKVHDAIVLAAGRCNQSTNNRATVAVHHRSEDTHVDDVTVLLIDRSLGTDPDMNSNDLRMNTEAMQSASSVRHALGYDCFNLDFHVKRIEDRTYILRPRVSFAPTRSTHKNSLLLSK